LEYAPVRLVNESAVWIKAATDFVYGYREMDNPLRLGKIKEITRMKRFIINFVMALAVCAVSSSFANAQATRTWVSGVGDDANPCSRTAPCKTFAGAISKTAPCGEISVLDPGGFGAVTITKAITINGDGTLAGILAATVNGIIVSAGASDDVIIRSISINGACSGLNGIRFLGGRSLHVENCTIYNFTQQGIDVSHNGTGAGQLSVTNTSFNNINNVAIRVDSTAGSPSASIEHVRIHRAGFGVDVLKTSQATISNSEIAYVTNQAIVAENTSTVNAAKCVLFKNGTGISAFNSGATIRFGDCDIYNNTVGVNVAAGATGDRFGNTRLFGNGTDTVGTTSLRTQQ
jgi:parallel beta helix pectate lyase-like protein